MTKSAFKNRARRVLDPAVSSLASLGVPPMLVSFFGLAFSLYGAVVVAHGRLLLGAVFLLLSGLCDVLDGDLARRRGMVTRFGAFIDSTFDRITEFAYFGGIVFLVSGRHAGAGGWELAMVLVALAGSVLTSYTRARAEGVGLDCRVGIMERPERIALLVAGLVLGYRVLMVVMVILAITSTLTFIQRIAHVHRLTRTDGSAPDDAPRESTPADPAG